MMQNWILKKLLKLLLLTIDLKDVSGCFDWIVSCYTETSTGFEISLRMLKKGRRIK